MKVSFPHQEDPHTRQAQPSRQRLLRVAAGVAAGLLLIVALVIVLRPQASLGTLARLEQSWGAGAYGVGGLAENWSIAIGSFFRSQIADLPEVPQLVIDVPFKDMSKLYQKREEALAMGHLVQGDDDFVNGSIRVDGRVVPIKLRLKGDWVDHLQGRKWSFRIRVRDGEHVLGMRRFSLQHPLTRGYHAELMYFELLRGFGVMVPRYLFVDVTLNGEDVGLMALEEFFAKELLEFNRRRESVIVRFDESLPWAARDSLSGEPVGWNGAFDDYRNAAIDGIGSTRIAESPVLAQQFRTAQGLLRGFADGKLGASQVFDVQQLGRFIAVSDVMGAWHATRWANLRFYLNPISLRLEPIPFDANLQEAFVDNRSIVNGEPILLDMLRDPAVWSVYVETLALLNQLAAEGTLQANLGSVEDEWLPVLQTEFRMLGEYPLDYLQERSATLYAAMSRVAAEDTDKLAYYLPFEQRLYPLLVHLSVMQDPDGSVVQVENAIPKDVTIEAIDWVNDETGERIGAVGDVLPLGVPPRGIGSPGQRLHLPLTPPPGAAGWALEATTRLAGRAWVATL
ncbi:MAG: CotH kinase family protein, partial [Woeseiaceae bacterium]|nr:CotH kinase family protein [Woeseiaceae bacterium]